MSDKFIGTNIDDYKIKKRCGAGKIGCVYLAEKEGEVVDRRAIKFIIGEDLREGWENEINKVTQLEMTDGVVPYISHGTTQIEGVSYRYIFWRYVKGGSLREYIDENKLTLPILKDLISRILSILHACQTISIQHGDLHSGNILIEDSNEMNIDPNLRRIWVTDFGYITSSMGKTPLDDLQGLVSIINDCIDSIDFHVLEGHEKYEYSQIKNEFIRKLAETNPVEYDFARSPRNLLEVFSTIIRQKLDTADQPKKKVGDYLVAENLGNRYDEWKSLFVPNS